MYTPLLIPKYRRHICAMISFKNLLTTFFSPILKF